MSRKDKNFDDFTRVYDMSDELKKEETEAAETVEAAEEDFAEAAEDAAAEVSGAEQAEDGVLPSELSDAEPAKKKNIFVRFFKWIGSWHIIVKILALLIVFALTTVGILAATAVKTVEEIVEEMNEDAEIPEDYDLSLQPVDGFINILLLGVDTRDMEEIKGSRSDMIMIASINTETYDVTLTSMYRDTYLKLGDTPG